MTVCVSSAQYYLTKVNAFTIDESRRSCSQNSRNHRRGSRFFSRALPLCLAGALEIPSGSHKGVMQMGRCQTETHYRTEASYLKSVLLWLQEYWTGPAVHVYPLRAMPQASLNIPPEGCTLH
jgi:hypothetical protein